MFSNCSLVFIVKFYSSNRATESKFEEHSSCESPHQPRVAFK